MGKMAMDEEVRGGGSDGFPKGSGGCLFPFVENILF